MLLIFRFSRQLIIYITLRENLITNARVKINDRVRRVHEVSSKVSGEGKFKRFKDVKKTYHSRFGLTSCDSYFLFLQTTKRKTVQEEKKHHDTLMGSISVAASFKGFLKQVSVEILQ